MKKQRYLVTIVITVGFIIFSCPAVAKNAVQVIVHTDNPNKTLSDKKMREIFLGSFLGSTKEWPKSKDIIHRVELPNNSLIRKDFLKNKLKVSSTRVAKERQKQNNGGRRPKNLKQVSNEQEVITYVAENTGAVGYISGSKELNNLNVKTLQVKSKKSSRGLFK
ncbi:MAG: hypothetical protein QTN59_13860 [Candidatus Electrothrix communis]|nr:MAG: hypothetical protein QTN59_13860 [Candidatus Electrothrix communis]